MNDTTTVILLDDDSATRRSVTLTLQLSGYRVQAYASAEEMLRSLDPAQSGCLLLDLRMPGMSGLEVQEALNALGCTLPVIFMSGFADVPTTVQALKGGAIDFVEKPFSPDALIEKIEEALAIDGRQRQEREWRERVRRRAENLTRREIEVMGFVTDGLSNKEIARQLGISPRTVEKYRARVMEKMNADNVPELCQMASGLTHAEVGAHPE
jgi:two-component system, LuxR family, response regulator FixJ